VDCPVTNRGPETVRAEVEALVTVRLLVEEVKVKLEEVAIGLVPLPNKMSLAVMAWEPVPPLATGKMPETEAELKDTAELYKAPEAVENTGRAEFKLVIVVEPTTTKGTPGVEVPMPALPLARTVSKEAPDEEATLKGLLVPVPWMLKLTVEEVALTPITVALLRKSEAELMVLAPVK